MSDEKLVFEVENIKCGGCANTIASKLNALDGVCDATIDIDNGVVSVSASRDQYDVIAGRLAELGYPEIGSAEGMASVKAKAKSFVSCAVGRMTGDTDASG